MSIDASKLSEVEPFNYCWMVGKSRLSKFECRLFPREPYSRRPVFIESGDSFDDAIEKALMRFWLADKSER